MPFTTAQQDLMDRTLKEEPNIPVNSLKRIIGSTNWLGVREYVRLFKSAAITEDMPEVMDYPALLGEPEDANLKALDTLMETASQSVTEARERLERCNYFLASVAELRKRYEEGHLTVK